MVAIWLVGCGGDDDNKVVDASSSIDTPAAVCTGAPYDPCTDNAQCASQQCRLFAGDGFQVCTANCDAANPCPMQNGAAVECNMMGRCKPGAANACTPP